MNETLKHKGYEGSVQYSAEDRLLHGRILGIRDTVIYDGDNVDEIEQNFRSAVEDYLAFCTEEGRAPNKPFRGSLNVRLREGLHARAAIYAERHDQKLNTLINNALDEYLTKSA